MPSYRRLSLFAAFFLACEFVVGMGGILTPRGEVFPFASWFLFVLVPNHTVEYDLEFRAVDGRTLEKPVRFSLSGREVGRVFIPHSVVSFQTIQALGKALEHGETENARALRRQIDTYCGPGRLEYDVVKVTYDPVPRYNTGAILKHQLLGSFVVREP